MTITPFGRYEAREPRVPRTIGAISDALRAGQRARFFAELLDARRGPELDGVLSVWWGRAMRDTAPGPEGLPAVAEAAVLPDRIVRAVLPDRIVRAVLPDRIVRALPARSTRPKGPRGTNSSRREEGAPEAGGRGWTRITVTVDAWLGAYAEELVEAGRAPSVSAVVNEALAARFRRERRARRVRIAKTETTRADTPVGDRLDPLARDRADRIVHDRSDPLARDGADPAARDRVGRLVVHIEVPASRPGGSPAAAE